MKTKTAYFLLIIVCMFFYGSLITSCTKKTDPVVYDPTANSQQIDPYRAFKPTSMIWNDTGNTTYWSRCWIHHFTYTSTGQLSTIFIKAFDSDSATSKPDSIFYTLTYDNMYSIFPTQYSYKYYGAGGGLLTNDVHKLISDQQVVYLDTANVGIRYAGGDTVYKCQFTYYNGKTTIIRSDFKDSCNYIFNGNALQQIVEYPIPYNTVGYQYYYTYPGGSLQYVNPFWYVKVYKYLYGNGIEGISKYLPLTNSGVYPNSPNYNFQTTFTYSIDSKGRVTVAKSNNTRERTTTVYSY